MHKQDFPITRSEVEQAIHCASPSFVRTRLQTGSFASATYPYLHMSAPKCACSKTKTLLWELEGHGALPNDIHARPPSDPRRSVLSGGAESALHLIFHPDVVRFRVCRDPISRLVSAYCDKIRSAPVGSSRLPDCHFATHRAEIAAYH